MGTFYEADGFWEDDTGRHPFYLTISNPSKGETGEDYYCEIHAPVLFNRDKRIYGVDEHQACALALEFVRQMLAGKRIIDASGNPIEGLGQDKGVRP
jgi:hypothetical protein